MRFDEELWGTHQYPVLVSFVHHLAYHRTLRQCYEKSQIESEFWRRTISVHLLQAIIDWCMVFGADSNDVHWKKVVVDKETQNSFRSRLLSVTGMTNEEWQAYWLRMTTFRNDFVAHKVVKTDYPSVPVLDMALLVVTAYDDWFRNSVSASFIEPPLKVRYEKLMRVSGETFVKLVSSGLMIEDEYEGNPPP